ncbi:hypothetical protein [Streptomyces albidocamelliae]|uniref:hypothetical protein n=1 Tax=Streptomyces albidocamelliae TaxID=2981135 RepID=UPI00385057D6
MNGVHHPVESTGNGGSVSSRSWWIYRGTGQPLADIRLADVLPPPPAWRDFDGGPVLPPVPAESAETDRRLGGAGRATPRQNPHDIDMINTALLLRRPLLVTGRPGIGKSTLAYLVARELGLGRVLHWGITSRSTLRSGLYEYDAIGRAQASSAAVRRPPGRPGRRAPPRTARRGRVRRKGKRGSGTSYGSDRWAPRCCRTSCRASCSSTSWTRATSTCPATSSMCWRTARTTSPSWSAPGSGSGTRRCSPTTRTARSR